MSKRTIITKDSITVRITESVPFNTDKYAYLLDKELEGELVGLYMRSNERDQAIVMEVFNRYKRIQSRLRLAEEFILNLENSYRDRVLEALLVNPSSAALGSDEP